MWSGLIEYDNIGCLLVCISCTSRWQYLPDWAINVVLPHSATLIWLQTPQQCYCGRTCQSSIFSH